MRVKRRNLNWNLDLNEGIDLSIFLFGSFEETSLRTMGEIVKPGMVVFDIGANIGAHTLHLANMVGNSGKVFAIEPTQWAFNKLTANLRLNPQISGRVVSFQVGFIAEKMMPPAEIISSWNLAAGFKSQSPLAGSAKSTNQACFCSFDEFVETHNIQQIDFIKIDIDGYEVDFLAGAQKAIAQFKPVILIELCPYALAMQGRGVEELIAALKRINYQLQDERSKEKLPMESRKLLSGIPSQGSINAIASPAIQEFNIR